MKPFQRNLKRIMKKRGWYLTEAARQFGMTPSGLLAIFKRGGNPSLDTILKIMKVTGATFNELVKK